MSAISKFELSSERGLGGGEAGLFDDFFGRQDAFRGIRALLDAAKKDVAKYKGRADKAARDLAETNKKIEYLRSNPIKRDDEELIDSFKNKLKKP